MKWQSEEKYFQQMAGKKVAWTISQPEDGLVRAGYPLYDQQLLDFVRKFKASPLYDHKYRKTLRHFHIKPKLNELTVSQALLINNARVANKRPAVPDYRWGGCSTGNLGDGNAGWLLLPTVKVSGYR